MPTNLINASPKIVNNNYVTVDAYFMPTYAIIMWSATYGGAIPTGWVLCDGTNGTPDLRDLFIIGAGGTYASDATATMGDTGTGYAVDTDAGHDHAIGSMSAVNEAYSSSPGTDAITQTGYASITDSGHTHSGSMPPYYALCFIMKT